MREFGIGMLFVSAGLAVFALTAGGAFYGWKSISVWSASKAGQAVLAEAEYSRQARVQEAKAKQAAAKFLAQSEIIKARGVAEANSIMAQSLGGPEGYLRWKYIEMLEETGQSSNTIVYIPTEGAMPILEAGRVAKATPKIKPKK